MKIGFFSLGCPKNLVDGEVMLGMARDAGHEITTDASTADVLVVNTCAFIDSAKQESIDAILEMATQKRDGQCSRLVVTGCLAERYRDELRREIPEIDAVLGTGEVPQILDAIGARDSALGTRQTRCRSADVLFPIPDRCHDSECRAPSPEPRAPSPRLPLRRRHASLPDDAEAFRLRQGRGRLRLHVRVLHHSDTARVLSQPDVGVDRPRGARARRAWRARAAAHLAGHDVLRHRPWRARRARAAAARAERHRRARWIRLLYLYPTTITDDVLDAMAECEKVCRYIDLPLQHASADVLKRMRRPGNRRTYDKLLGADPATGCPDVTLRTTLIVGFPGETDADFAELDGFVADTGFDHVGVFTYSHEEGTRAFGLRRRRAGGGQEAATKCADGASKEDSGPRAPGPDRHARPPSSSTARPPSTRWCCRAGSKGRRRISIRWSILTDCDPTAYAARHAHPRRSSSTRAATTSWPPRSAEAEFWRRF